MKSVKHEPQLLKGNKQTNTPPPPKKKKQQQKTKTKTNQKQIHTQKRQAEIRLINVREHCLKFIELFQRRGRRDSFWYFSFVKMSFFPLLEKKSRINQDPSAFLMSSKLMHYFDHGTLLKNSFTDNTTCRGKKM